MKDLTDLEVCKRITEIEGLTYCISKGMNDTFVDLSLDEDICEYNPLTDDALIFNLAFTNKVKIDYFDECVYIAMKRKLTRCKFNKDDIESLRKAICLSIIKAHE